ncbi:hypothetical protein M9458_043074, partial [Cirrhinus mrigala]
MCPYMVVPVPVPSHPRSPALSRTTPRTLCLAIMTYYPDSCLCSSYQAGQAGAQLLAAYIEWVLVSCKSLLTADFADDTNPSLDPVPSPPSPRSMEHQPEPTGDRRAIATELRIDPEPEPVTSHQVREPATSLAREELKVEHKDAEEDPAHCTSAEGELKLDLGQMDLINFDVDIYADMPPLILPSSELSVDPEPSVCSDLSACLDFPPTLALLPHPLIPASPTICAVGSPRVCQFPLTSWLEDPSSPPPPIGPPAPPAPGLVVDLLLPQDSTPPAMPRRIVPPAPLGSSLPPAPSQSSVALTPARTSGSPPQSALPPPWLLPPWAAIMAAAWVSPGSSCSGSLLSPPWLLPLSDPPWTLLSPPWLLPPSPPS